MAKTTGPKEVEDTSPVNPAPANPGQVYVVAVHGDLRHLYTNVVFTKDPKKVSIDGFLQAQLDAGKLQVVNP